MREVDRSRHALERSEHEFYGSERGLAHSDYVAGALSA